MNARPARDRAHNHHASARTLTIGLDGCSWNVLEPLLESGELPHLAALRADGAAGVLESTVPFFTGPAWSSFATGASPAAHGVYDFMMLREDGRLSVARRSDLRRKTYYQQLGEEQQRSVLINLPLDQGGCEGAVIVNSWLTDDDVRRILPMGRRERYARLLEAYRTFPTNPADIDELCEIERTRFALARELFLGEEWQHFFVLFSSTDWLGHQATGHLLEGDDDARARFLRLYRQLDSYVGWFVEHAPDALVIVLSDHGQCAEEVVLRVNGLLRELGLVELAENGAAGPDPFFVSRRPKPRTVRVPPWLSKLRTNRALRPGSLLVKRAVNRTLGVELTRASHRVDRKRSRAFMPTDASFGVYMRDVDGEVDGVREALLELRLPDGRPAIEGVWTPQELYGRSEAAGPTLLFAPALGVRPSATIKDRVVDLARAPGRGCHQRDGILLVGGDSVQSADLGRCSIFDLAPTILWAMGAGIPAEGDGRVLFEAFDPAVSERRPVREVEGGWVEEEGGGPESDEVLRRLKALGYI